VPPVDLLDDIASALRSAGHNVEVWLEKAVSVTGEWILSRGPEGQPLRPRLAPRRVAENLLPVRLRSLEEVLMPQPRTAAVMANLLDWIDRVDRAAQVGEMRPEFATPDGEAIFPEDPWWLTEVERRAQPADDAEPEEAPSADEDGPASAREEVSDEAPVVGLGRSVHLAWRVKPASPAESSQTEAPRVDKPAPVFAASVPHCFFERQKQAYCAMHAINNALGIKFCTEKDMEAACDEVLRAAAFEGKLPSTVRT
jgi:hypothetical protein